MNILLKNTLPGVPTRVDVNLTPCFKGGEGTVYFTKDDKYAIKIFHHETPDKELVLGRVIDLFNNLPDDQKDHILPPLGLVDLVDGKRAIGFIMRKVPSSYKELHNYIFNVRCFADQLDQNFNWAHYLKLARGIADALVVLHGKGCTHTDIQYRNYLVNLQIGDAILLEMDGVVVPGYLPHHVLGMQGFMAPEILTQQVRPNERTDRHSLAVLLIYTLLFRNPLMPLCDYADDPATSEQIGFGSMAVFSEHPTDTRNRPSNLNKPLFNAGALSYRMLTPTLQKLTERALIDGLFFPDKRPSAREWDHALACAYDELFSCKSCSQFAPYPYTVHPQQRTCPFCGASSQVQPAVFDLYEGRGKYQYAYIDRRIVLGHGYPLLDHIALSGKNPPLHRKTSRKIGHLEWDHSRHSYMLIHEDVQQWTEGKADGSRRTVTKGESIVIKHGTKIQLGEKNRILLCR